MMNAAMISAIVRHLLTAVAGGFAVQYGIDGDTMKDGTVTLREPHEITERHRRPLKTLMARLNETRMSVIFQEIVCLALVLP